MSQTAEPGVSPPACALFLEISVYNAVFLRGHNLPYSLSLREQVLLRSYKGFVQVCMYVCMHVRGGGEEGSWQYIRSKDFCN